MFFVCFINGSLRKNQTVIFVIMKTGTGLAKELEQP